MSAVVINFDNLEIFLKNHRSRTTNGVSGQERRMMKGTQLFHPHIEFSVVVNDINDIPLGALRDSDLKNRGGLDNQFAAVKCRNVLLTLILTQVSHRART